MDVTLVHCDVESGRLHGFVVGAGGPLAIHLHGTWGNFYENPFVTTVAGAYVERGWRYASVNLPSHDGGSTREEVTDSLVAICRWVAELTSGDGPVLLQGHSLGALKAIRLMHDPEYADLARRVAGLVLLSPFDIVAFYGGADADAVSATRAAVSAHATQVGADALVPASVFDIWPISTATFLDMTKDGGVWDVFPSRVGSATREWITGTGRPALVAIGGADFAAFPDPATVVAGLQEVAGVTATVVPDAPHNFAGHEEVLSDHIGRFLAALR